ncbi:MAG: glucose-6-phosphate isomerase [Syntrophobacterales bacterium CG_4_8_14_3_um_filter_58_8]|nr:MAG: glucose-6-phosphate isomerase [Syntrophobacterales bacterium CG03_land_8_20_14_0_80_58_14]PJC73558.1 MAG: glucose-6-phosphate isomerase [Syntrophobacterales bacterium CG_4_8_14_3_um_filter_58_8]
MSVLSIEGKKETAMTTRMTFRPDSCRAAAGEARKALAAGRVAERIRRKDHTVWKSEPAEIANRLGWLDSPRAMQGRLAEIATVVEGVRADGFNFALLLGMGGSSLASEVFRKVFGAADGFLDLAVLDSTDPGAVLARAERLDRKRTLFVVSTKSGGTVETLSFMRYFYNLVAERFGEEAAGRRFIAITDPGSALTDLARAHDFRYAFLNDPEIGGRYSALSCFGLVPAALMGMDVRLLLERAAAAADCEFDSKDEEMSGAALGTLLGEFAAQGRDKLTFLLSPQLAAFGDWVEQLLAESLGKKGEGILPVVGEEFGPPPVYGPDRIFCSLRLAGDAAGEAQLKALAEAGHPVIDIELADPYDLGGHCFFWEMATAVAGWRLAINPFDQPDVEAAKVLARKMITEYREKGAMPVEIPALKGPGLSVYGDLDARKPEGTLTAFLGQAKPGAYAALHAYLTPSPGMDEALQRLRMRIRDRFHFVTTVGYGPRFLHSTGQLHKGDAGRGLFIQFTADDPRDAPIPDEMGRPESALSFGVLKQAQVFGDRQALINAGRRVIRIHLHEDPADGISSLTAAL